jgi:hypothetical protein
MGGRGSRDCAAMTSGPALPWTADTSPAFARRPSRRPLRRRYATDSWTAWRAHLPAAAGTCKSPHAPVFSLPARWEAAGSGLSGCLRILPLASRGPTRLLRVQPSPARSPSSVASLRRARGACQRRLSGRPLVPSLSRLAIPQHGATVDLSSLLPTPTASRNADKTIPPRRSVAWPLARNSGASLDALTILLP